MSQNWIEGVHTAVVIPGVAGPKTVLALRPADGEIGDPGEKLRAARAEAVAELSKAPEVGILKRQCKLLEEAYATLANGQARVAAAQGKVNAALEQGIDPIEAEAELRTTRQTIEDAKDRATNLQKLIGSRTSLEATWQKLTV